MRIVGAVTGSAPEEGLELKRAVSIAMLVCLVFCLGADDEPRRTVFETYSLGQKDHRGLQETVEKLVGKEGQVIYYKDGNELIVSTTYEKHKVIAALVKSMAQTAPSKMGPNIRIDVHFIETTREKHYGASVEASGGVKVTRKGKRAHFKFSPSIRGQSSTGSMNARQTIVVRNGGTARLKVGEEVPFYEWLMDYSFANQYIEQRFEMREVGASLLVEPTLVGNGPLIQVRLIPEMSGLVDNQVNRIQYKRVATDVTIKDGSTITIGGLAKNKEFYNRFLAGAERGGFASGLNITLSARIVSAGR